MPDADTIDSGSVVTRAVSDRLRADAETTVAEGAGLVILRRVLQGVLWAVIPWLVYLANVVSDHFDSGRWSGEVAWAVFLGGAVGVPLVAIFVVSLGLLPLQARHQQALDRQVASLAAERKNRIEEREEFYSSSEWRSLRGRVISEEGNVCSECRRVISDEGELAVDHIRPRSKYPELALVRENLQVLCRSCNSAKGATDNAPATYPSSN